MKKGCYDNVMPDLTLEIDGTYDSFSHFYKQNKSVILKKIIELFKEIPNTKKDRLILSISTYIPYRFTSMVEYGKSDKDVLLLYIIPYFERMEEYELCTEILELHDRLN